MSHNSKEKTDGCQVSIRLSSLYTGSYILLNKNETNGGAANPSPSYIDLGEECTAYESVIIQWRGLHLHKAHDLLDSFSWKRFSSIAIFKASFLLANSRHYYRLTAIISHKLNCLLCLLILATIMLKDVKSLQ